MFVFALKDEQVWQCRRDLNPLITRLKDVPLDHFASAPGMPCKLKKLLFTHRI